MRIDVIDRDDDFDAVRANWDAVFLRDQHAQHFLSWVWMRSYLKRRGRWFILALRESEPGSAYVAFFPLRLVTYRDKLTGLFCDEIIMAGNYAADYTGFIADPAYERQAIEGFSTYLHHQRWTHLKLDYFGGSPERQQAMVQAMRGPALMHRDSAIQNKENIDNCICPVVSLPARWDDYLDTHMSSQTRQKLRRFLRKIEGDEAYRIRFATAETIKGDLDILFALWRAKWLPQKGERRIDRLIASSREMLMDCFDDGNLEVPVLWHGQQPLGALANIVDRQKKTVHFYMTGRDESWTTPSPGLVLHGYCIRRAIEAGFRYYDFLRGNEPYKYMFGPVERRISCTLFQTRTGRNLGDKLNLRSIRHVYDRGRDFYRKGHKQAAEGAFQQVIDAAPEHLGALFGLANISFEKGRIAEAEVLYRTVAAKTSDPVPVQIKLGDTQLALRRYGEAAQTFSDIIERSPHNSEAHYKHGVALVAAKRLLEAAKAFRQLETYHSDDAGHALYRDKAAKAGARILNTVPAFSPASRSDLQLFAKDGPELAQKRSEQDLRSSVASPIRWLH
jgi:CelD/BcsL family acetyltransferase involved in cellulose biosynthesis